MATLCIDEIDHIEISPTVELKQDESITYIQKWNMLCDQYKSTFEQDSQMNCQQKEYDINQCPCCLRIIIIFNYCQKAKGFNKIYTDTFGIFPEYNLTLFQNDMDHIIIHHGNEVNTDEFTNKIGKCDIEDCRVPARESRNGIQSPRIFPSTNTTLDLQQIIRQLFIEEYHAYLFHPITPKRNNNNNIHKFVEIYPDRNDRFVSIPTTNNTSTNNNKSSKKKIKNAMQKSMLGPVVEEDMNDMEEEQKYDYLEYTNGNMNVEMIEYKQDIININDDSEDIIHSPHEQKFFRFGHKFSYHRYKMGMKNKKEVCLPERNYVGCKFENLKKELIDDPTKSFTVAKWNIVIAISSALADKDGCKKLKAKTTIYGWTTEPGKQISIARIVALKLYTDYDALSFKLCETYRTDINDKKKQKQAHSRFAHWAKLLTSTVDIFGQQMKKGESFYRGLNGKPYLFSLFSTDFNAPTSTTLIAGVAWSFAFDGIVVQIEKPDWRDGARYMNMVPFSAFKSECENLFVGPDNFLKIKSIHQHLSKKITSTEPLLLLQILTHKMSGHDAINNKKIDMKNVISERPNVISEAYHNLENRFNNDENIYKYQLTNYFVNKKAKLYIKVKLVEDLIRCALRKNQKTECTNLLKWLVDCNGSSNELELMHKKKQFYINFIGINELFVNINQITFDFKNCNYKLNENNNKTWNNILKKYMFKYWNNDANQTKNRSKVCKIVLQRLDKLPSQQFMEKIKKELEESRWNVLTTIDSKNITFFRGSIAHLHQKQNNNNNNPKKHNHNHNHNHKHHNHISHSKHNNNNHKYNGISTSQRNNNNNNHDTNNNNNNKPIKRKTRKSWPQRFSNILKTKLSK